MSEQPKKLQYGSAEWWILDAILKFGPMTKHEILTIGTHETQTALANLGRLHMVITNPDKLIQLQPKGRAALNSCNRTKPGTIKPTKALPRSMSMKDSPNYEGLELRAFQIRPGATDAFTLPSVMGGERIWPDGRREKV